MKVGMSLSSPWIAGVLSSLAAFLLAYSIESFRSLPLFWFFYIVMGAVWLVVTATRAIDKVRTIVSIPSLLLLLGIASLFVNFVPLGLALFIVYVNTLPLASINHGWRVLGDVLESFVHVVLAFVLVLVSGYMPLVVVPLAYVLAGIAMITSIGRTRTGNAPKWPGALLGIVLVVVLVIFKDNYSSLGAAAAAAGVVLLVGLGRTLIPKKQRTLLPGK